MLEKNHGGEGKYKREERMWVCLTRKGNKGEKGFVGGDPQE